jgi:guanylate kinase
MNPLVFIVSAPSGSGKSTLLHGLLASVERLHFSISYTTRPPRGSEQSGREYFFIAREEFQRMIQAGEFLEHADVFGNYYGTAKRFLDEARQRGADLLLDIDVQGAAQIKQKLPQAITIFVLPPSREELERRLRRRSQAENALDDQVLQRRLRAAAKEIENWSRYDYLIVNDQLEPAIERLRDIVVAERLLRSGGKLSSAEEALVGEARKNLQANMCPQVAPILASFADTAVPGRS